MYRDQCQHHIRTAGKVLQARFEAGIECSKEREDIAALKFMVMSMKSLSGQIKELSSKTALEKIELARIKAAAREHEEWIADKEENISVMEATLASLNRQLDGLDEDSDDPGHYDADYTEDIRATVRGASSSGPSQ